MPKFGLIGYPLGHSFSQKYFTEKFKTENIPDTEYLNFPINQIDQFPLLVHNNIDLIGLNATIPYKEKIIPYLNELDDVAAKIGAVNTIKIVRNIGETKLIGYNTDYFGFEQSLKPYLKKHHQKSLILGTGGASKAVAYVFESLGVKYNYVSRNPVSDSIYSYEQLTSELIQEYHIIVNTSPLGMYPKVDECPSIPYNSLTKDHILYDLIYNPEKTLFLQKGENAGAVVINGLPMLHIQAEKAWEIWNS